MAPCVRSGPASLYARISLEASVFDFPRDGALEGDWGKVLSLCMIVAGGRHEMSCA